MHRTPLPSLLVATALSAVGWLVENPLYCRAAEAQAARETAVDFVRDIQPILADRCHACHGEDAQEGQLRLDARAIVLHGGVSGPALVQGDSERSLLLQRVTSSDDDLRMPPDDEPLTAEQVELLRRWIAAGAPWPAGAGPDIQPQETHWAYLPPQRPALPRVQDPSWVRTPIDAFILRKLDSAGLRPAPRAERARLLRRLSLDLIGIPPTVAEVDAFLADDRPDAYDRVVDRLLASPQYGVRWARPWLDAARYADSNGYQADQYRNVWPYRDWVIRAMNDDMPFDQFTLEQLAGDLLPAATISQKIATGFARLTTCNVEAGVDPEENRVNQIIDRVNTTGTVWLGTTMECAQCHNHKYDPFTQQDYYQLFAYFNNTPLEVEGNGVTYNFVGPKMDLPLAADQQAQREELIARRRQLTTVRDAAIEKRLSGDAMQRWEQAVASARATAPTWHVMEIESFTSSGGASHAILEDQSVLVGGPSPDKDTYTVVVKSGVSGITGFKLETLTDPSLPGGGPGRHSDQRPNFVLNEFTAQSVQADTQTSSPQPILLRGAQADFSQARFDVGGAIDGDPKTAWAINPEFGKSHAATFLTRQPLTAGADSRFVFTLDQRHGGGRTIGRLRLAALTGQPATDMIPAAIAKILDVPQEQRTAQQANQLRDHFTGLDPDVAAVDAQLATLKKQIDAITPITTLVMVEQQQVRESAIFRRGDFLQRGRSVQMQTPATLPALGEEPTGDRRELARWLVDQRNPLTARVAVNRWWAGIFGRGIVGTIEDFGTQGDRPTHPELLDWLATELVARHWSMKHIHRLIVSSNCYQQSSKGTPAMFAEDPYNQLYARGPRFRLPAETVRDNALAVAGLLSHTLDGPPVFPPQPAGVWRHVGRNAPKYATSQGDDRVRRGIYVIWRRSAPYPSFTNFDAPDRASCVVNRPRTNTPLQALTLMNDEAYVEMAISLAQVIAGRKDLTSEERIVDAFRRAVSRLPTDAEVRVLADVYDRERSRYEQSPAAAEKLVGKQPAGVNTTEIAAWFFVANILLNLDETITKG